MPKTPDLAPLTVITLPSGAEVYPKPETDARDAKIASYIVVLKGVAYDCANQLQRNADYWR